MACTRKPPVLIIDSYYCDRVRELLNLSANIEQLKVLNNKYKIFILNRLYFYIVKVFINIGLDVFI